MTTSKTLDKMKVFPIAFGVAAIGFPIAALATGGALLLGLGNSSEPTRQGFAAVIGILGGVGVFVIGSCAVMGFLLQLCGVPLQIGFFGSYGAVCAAFAAMVCAEE